MRFRYAKIAKNPQNADYAVRLRYLKGIEKDTEEVLKKI